MIIDEKSANDFLVKYQLVMMYLNNGEIPNGVYDLIALRPEIYDYLDEIEENIQHLVTEEFITSLKNAVFGQFIFLKKYKDGYVFLHLDTGKYYQVLALTTPIEELCPDYSLVETAILPFCNTLVCDGLLLPDNVIFGKNKEKEFRDGYWEAKKSGELIK